MAKQTWNNPIDKNVDWGGDESTGGLPVSGEQVYSTTIRPTTGISCSLMNRRRMSIWRIRPRQT